MKFTTDRDMLLKHVKDLGTKGSNRVKEAVRFTAIGRRKVQMILANPWDGSVRAVTMPATTCSETTLTIPRTQLQAALEMAPKGKITIASTKQTATINDSISIEIHDMDYADDVFTIKQATNPLVLPAATFKAMVAEIGHAVCQDITKYNLHGIYFRSEEKGGGTLRAVATDGHRLALTSRIGWYPTQALLVPNCILAIVKPLIKGTEEAPLSLGIYSPPPPPVEYEDIYEFNRESSGGSSNATYNEKSFLNFKKSQADKIESYDKQLATADDGKITWLKGKIDEAGKYLAYLDTIVPTQREVKKTVCKTFIASWGPYTFSERIDLGGEFPDYTRAIPALPAKATFQVDAKDLLDIVKRIPCGKVGMLKYNRVTMEFSQSDCKISQYDPDKGITFTEKIPVETESIEPVTISLNQRYIADALAVIEREAVFQLNDETRPVLIEDADNEGRQFVIMPMRP